MLISANDQTITIQPLKLKDKAGTRLLEVTDLKIRCKMGTCTSRHRFAPLTGRNYALIMHSSGRDTFIAVTYQCMHPGTHIAYAYKVSGFSATAHTTVTQSHPELR